MATSPPRVTPVISSGEGLGGCPTKGEQLLTGLFPNILLLLLLRQACEALESSIPLAVASFSSTSLSPLLGVL